MDLDVLHIAPMRPFARASRLHQLARTTGGMKRDGAVRNEKGKARREGGDGSIGELLPLR